jgi:hypothetical protein
LALGDPVIHLENDYEALVFNGTLGVVVEVLPDGIQVQWDGHDRPMDFREDRRYALDLAYAISVHKAQGSQFRRVVIPVFPNRLLDRTLVYTALTRAQEQVVLVGDRDAMEAAEPAAHRDGGGRMVMPALEGQPGFRAQTSPSFGGISGGFPPDVLPAVRSIARAPRKGWGLGGGRERDAGSMRSVEAGVDPGHPRTPRVPGPEGLAVPGAVPGAVLAGRAATERWVQGRAAEPSLRNV